MARWLDLAGTLLGKIQLGLGGPFIKGNSGTVEARNAADSAMAAIRASLVQVYGDDIELNAGATEAGADWKLTIRRPATGMTHNLTVVFPATDPAPGQALTVASLAGDVITLQYTTIAAGTDKLVIDTTTIGFGTSSPAAMFTKPDGAIVERVQVVIDEPFDGDDPQLSIGISGTTSKFMGAGQNDLTAPAGTVFEVTPGLPAGSGTEALIATLAPDSSTQGSARVLVSYAIPG